jgi:hypothetical protein
MAAVGWGLVLILPRGVRELRRHDEAAGGSVASVKLHSKTEAAPAQRGVGDCCYLWRMEVMKWDLGSGVTGDRRRLGSRRCLYVLAICNSV